MKKVLLSLSLLAFLAPLSLAAPPSVAWEENFDKPDSPASGVVIYDGRYSGLSGEAVVHEVKDGVLRLGVAKDAARIRDRVSVQFGVFDWSFGSPIRPAPSPQWGPFDLSAFPVIELRWRGARYDALFYHVETAGGKRISGYLNIHETRREKDPDGSEWIVTTNRIAPDSAVPTNGTAVKLLGINFNISVNDGNQDWITDLDYVRIRSLTDEEAAAEKNIVASFTGFPAARWRGFDTFFPFGAYTAGYYLRGPFEYWGGDYEGSYANYVRHNFNYIAANDEIELGRFRGQSSDEGLAQWIGEMTKLVDSARATGMRVSVDIRRLMEGRDPAQGYEQLLPIAKRIASAFPDDSTTVSWTVWDEPGAEMLPPLVRIIRAIREADPLGRPEMLVFNNTTSYTAFSGYLNLCYFDLYPILQGDRNPWAIRQTVKSYRQIAPDKPIWVVLQAFETLPPAAKGLYVLPSDAELRLMTMSALAEGAKGFVWYEGWMGFGKYEGMTRRAGQPHPGLMPALSDLARRLIPIGTQMLSTDPIADPGFRVQQAALPEGGHGIVVSALRDRKDTIVFLVVVNEDVEHPRSADVALPAEILPEGAGVYDLYALLNQDLAADRMFTVETLACGDGRVYAVCAPDVFERLRNAILSKKALEKLRVLTPDLTIARRWKLPLDEVEAAIGLARRLADAGDAQGAVDESDHANRLLVKVLEDDSELDAATRAFENMRADLAELSRIAEYESETPKWWTGGNHPMLVPNPGFLDLSKRYFEVGRAYRDLYSAYLAGDREPLRKKLQATRMDCMRLREDLLGFLREKLKPSEEPAQPVQ
ncbi:MAG: hypothetical protein V2A58_18460 [Planctomycetota bacterium]